MNDPFEGEIVKPEPRDGFYDDLSEVSQIATQVHCETLSLDITPIGTHYLLTHLIRQLLTDRITFCDLKVILMSHLKFLWKSCSAYRSRYL